MGTFGLWGRLGCFEVGAAGTFGLWEVWAVGTFGLWGGWAVGFHTGTVIREISSRFIGSEQENWVGAPAVALGRHICQNIIR